MQRHDQHLRARIPVGAPDIGGPTRKEGCRKREHQPSGIDQHVPRVGDESERP